MPFQRRSYWLAVGVLAYVCLGAMPGATRPLVPALGLVLLPAWLAEVWRRTYAASEGERGDYVGVMAPDGWIDETTLAAGGLVLFAWGAWSDWAQLGRNLFAGLRYLDKPGVRVILCPLPSAEGMGLALRDRLMRAARTS